MSVALGYNYYQISTTEINLILTTFIICPSIAITFSAIYGIWASNDYSAYEYSYVKSKNFKPEEISTFQKLTVW